MSPTSPRLSSLSSRASRRVSLWRALWALCAVLSPWLGCTFTPAARNAEFSCYRDDGCPGEGERCVSNACVHPDRGLTGCPTEFIVGNTWWFESFEAPTCSTMREELETTTPKWFVYSVYGSGYDDELYSYESEHKGSSGARSCRVSLSTGLGTAEAPLHEYGLNDERGPNGFVGQMLAGRVCVSARVRPATQENAGMRLRVSELIESGTGSSYTIEPSKRGEDEVVAKPGEWTDLVATATLDGGHWIDISITPQGRKDAAFLVDDIFVGVAP